MSGHRDRGRHQESGARYVAGAPPTASRGIAGRASSRQRTPRPYGLELVNSIRDMSDTDASAVLARARVDGARLVSELTATEGERLADALLSQLPAARPGE